MNLARKNFAKFLFIIILLIAPICLETNASINNTQNFTSDFSIKTPNQDIDFSVNNLGLPYGANDIKINDTYAYVNYDWSIQQIDLKNPNNPSFKYIEYPFIGQSLDIDGEYIYTLDSLFASGYTFNINTLNKTYSTFYLMNNQDSLFIPSNLSGMYGYENFLVVQDPYAFALLSWHDINFNAGEADFHYTLSIFDVSNKSEIVELSRFNRSAFCSDFHISDGFIYITTRDFHASYEDVTLSFISKGLDIINITDYQNPSLLKTVDLDYSPTSIIVEDNSGFITFYEVGFRIYDFSDLTNPTPITSYIGGKTIFDVITSDSTAYLLLPDKLVIYDISDFNNIQLLSSKSPRFFGDGTFHRFARYNEYIIAGRIVNYQNKPLFIFDCTNTNRPKIIYPYDRLFLDVNSFIILLVCGYILAPITIILFIGILIYKLKKRYKVSIQSEDAKKVKG
jgi:hypothetical protein